MTERNMLPPK
jgi:hypothetical protein